MNPGVRFSPSSTLVARALEELERGPRSASDLARAVLGVRAAPPGVAERIVQELLAGERRVERAGEDRWRLTRERSPSGPLAALSYVVVDVETTGASPGRGDRITEIAAVEVRHGAITDEFSSLVNPGMPIPAWISRLTGISDDMVCDAPRFEEIAGLVRERLEGRVFVAHNAPFDWRFVSAEMRRAASVLPSGPRLCTLRLARRALPGLARKGLDSVTEYYGIEIEGRHRAGGDAVATAGVLLRLLEEVERRGFTEWGDLQGWLSGPRGAPR
ncbi:MAG: 3'-5' exonuclease [Candidatus Palauibacterales bacterium]|nr:3'-5' exonuclease [Candidatus Palauibacterales bacterium]MDP2530552.1 3'-5' exonuclease [Candidatus Palauibacterales bacterium]MDP2582889.1 3'-5' exonuclease [Candidatus Palauibacterales bacterium]